MSFCYQFDFRLVVFTRIYSLFFYHFFFLGRRQVFCFAIDWLLIEYCIRLQSIHIFNLISIHLAYGLLNFFISLQKKNFVKFSSKKKQPKLFETKCSPLVKALSFFHASSLLHFRYYFDICYVMS